MGEEHDFGRVEFLCNSLLEMTSGSQIRGAKSLAQSSGLETDIWKCPGIGHSQMS